MNGAEPNDWLEAGLRHPPTAEEERQWQAYLAAHPAERQAREEDLRLNQLLRQLPDAPLASNFTTRVLQALDRETARQGPTRWRPALANWVGRLNWVAATALLALALTLGALAYQRHRRRVQSELARSLAAVTPVATLPTLEMLEHFDAIRRLSLAPPVPDRDLLTASQ
ncbi:MAG: hypothetical protein KGS61_18645 [Verrucomicrobia bacterium]|nr:hypothetical protein [Verrucomicrobiota bacterium]